MRAATPPNARTRTLYFEYDPATGKLTLPPDVYAGSSQADVGVALARR